MKSSTVEQLGGRGAGEHKSQLRADYTESVVYWCKVKDSCEDQSSGQGAEPHEIMPNTLHEIMPNRMSGLLV